MILNKDPLILNLSCHSYQWTGICALHLSDLQLNAIELNYKPLVFTVLVTEQRNKNDEKLKDKKKILHMWCK